MALCTKGVLPVCLFCLGFGTFFFFGFFGLGLLSGDDDGSFPLFLGLALVVPSLFLYPFPIVWGQTSNVVPFLVSFLVFF